MARVEVTPILARHLDVPKCEVPGASVREVLDELFERHPKLRSYVLEDHGALRKHVVIFVNSEVVRDRKELGDAVTASCEVVIMQALSGG